MNERTATLDREALDRARSQTSIANECRVVSQFAARGIPESDIRPRDNILTYRAWRAVGRQVRRGEKSVKITTWITIADRTDPTVKRQAPRTACVFHISQTDPLAA